MSGFNPRIPRETARDLGWEAVAIIETGQYRAPSGDWQAASQPPFISAWQLALSSAWHSTWQDMFVLALQLPSQLPSHLPEHSTGDPSQLALHSPWQVALHCASHSPLLPAALHWPLQSASQLP